jgi:predicted transcriptional regulator
MVMRRDKLKVIIGILEICDGESINKTTVVYQSNLNFKTAGVYLNMLKNEGLVEVTKPGPREKYRTTKKGREILRNIKKVYDRMGQYSLE